MSIQANFNCPFCNMVGELHEADCPDMGKKRQIASEALAFNEHTPMAAERDAAFLVQLREELVDTGMSQATVVPAGWEVWERIEGNAHLRIAFMPTDMSGIMKLFEGLGPRIQEPHSAQLVSEVPTLAPVNPFINTHEHRAGGNGVNGNSGTDNATDKRGGVSIDGQSTSGGYLFPDSGVGPVSSEPVSSSPASPGT